MKALNYFQFLFTGICGRSVHYFLVAIFILPSVFMQTEASAQCVPESGSIKGKVYLDHDFSGGIDNSDPGLEGLSVFAFDAGGNMVSKTLTASDGTFKLAGLSDQKTYRMEFGQIPGLVLAHSGLNSNSNMRFVTAPACEQDLLLHDPLEYCNANPSIMFTQFFQGTAGENDNASTLKYIPIGFGTNQTITPAARKASTGSVWGMVFSRKYQTIFNSAFVKQYAQLGPNGLGAIYKTRKVNGQYQTSLYIDLVAAGINLGNLTVTNPKDCNYGAQVGRIGLGNLAISEKREELYVINIAGHSILSMPVNGAKSTDIREIPLPLPVCTGGNYYAFALTEHNDKLYIGVTCNAESSKLESDLAVHIYEFDLGTETFTHIFGSNYPKGFWMDNPSSNTDPKHWLTDITFTDEGNMLISLNDRTGNRFCFGQAGRLDVQNGDMLVVWNNNGVWTLENNGTAGLLTGSGVNNNQGPGGGEFFGIDAWPKDPVLHPEIFTGTAMSLPGTGSVVAAVYDPEQRAYSGGMYKLNTSNGTKQEVITVYNHKTYPEMGKATGFGELALICDPLPATVGNFVWVDQNKNGVHDPGEPGLPNVLLNLYDGNCILKGSTYTDTEGRYVFTGLEPGESYYIVMQDPDFNTQFGNLQRGGDQYFLTLSNRNIGDLSDLHDSDATIAQNGCTAFNGYPYIPVGIISSGLNQMNFNFGLTNGTIFDLAVKKTLVTDAPVRMGDVVPFKFEVFNQGTEEAREVTITDYINSGYIFDSQLNPGWKYYAEKNVARYKLQSALLPGSQQLLQINLIVKPVTDIRNLVNLGEISSALNSKNQPGIDLDCVFDEIPDNDGANYPKPTFNPWGGLPPRDDTGHDKGHEDDFDWAWPNIIDLAMKKTVKNEDELFLPGSDVTFQFTVYNQGNVPVEGYELIDYLPEELIFEPALNPGWTRDVAGDLVFTQNDIIYPNSMQAVELKVKVARGTEPGELINFAEIAKMVNGGHDEYRDFDSDPDRNPDNNVGGEPGGLTDDVITSNARAALRDDDDHDPAIIHIRNFDLALTKTAIKNIVEAGDLITFEIEIFNQSIIPADEITLVDYIPAGLTLEDNAWTLDPTDNTKANITLSIQNGLLPLTGLAANKSVKILITYRVNISQTVGFITNRAEIKSTKDIAGNNMTPYDSDSTPDNNTNGEDDLGMADIYVSSTSQTQDCNCLNNASNYTDGQFQTELALTAPSGQGWYISAASGFYSTASLAPPALPVEYLYDGSVLMTETPLGNGFSIYRISGRFIDGLTFTVTVKNSFGDQSYFEKTTEDLCFYQDIVVRGPAGTCGGVAERYSVANPRPGAVYTWSIGSGGSFVGSNTGVSVDILWQSVLGGPHLISVQNTGTGTCQSPGILAVAIGVSAGAMSSQNLVNASFDQFGQVVVNAGMVLTTGFNPNAVYEIILTLPDGTKLPGNIIGCEYAGIPISVKVVDYCSNNSANTIIICHDFLAPVLDCSDQFMDCLSNDDMALPVATDNCGQDLDIILVNQTTEFTDCSNTDFSQIIERTFVAVDAAGNQSIPCTQHVYVNRANVEDIVFPEPLLVNNNSALICGTYPTCNECDCSVFPFPKPEVSGVPTLNGEPIYPPTLGSCQFVTGFQDVVLADTPCFKKIRRFWTVHEICGEINVFNMISYEQDIEIYDVIPPIPVDPQNMQVSTDGMACGAHVKLPALSYTDNCSEKVRVDMSWADGFLYNKNGATVWLPKGNNKIWYYLYDECGNSSQVEMDVMVVDHSAPVAICQRSTTVTLNNHGVATVPAHVFDSGSWDECSVVHMEVKRMDTDPTCRLNQNILSPTITFCCTDAGKVIPVVLRVYDEANNWNECLVNVWVQDNVAPLLTIPADKTIDCEFPYNLNDMSYFGSATYYDVCGATLTEHSESYVNDCGVGYINRIFTVTDGVNTVTKTQRITIENRHPYQRENIDWPEDYISTAGCDTGELNPENLPSKYGFPILNNEGPCSQLGMVYHDVIFPVNNAENACYQIVRTWKVMDWCQFVNNQYVVFQHDQIIKVMNSVPPVITSTLPDLLVCSYDDDCEKGFIELKASGNDDCTELNKLRWFYSIDLFMDGIVDSSGSWMGAYIDLSDEFPIGTHEVRWTLEDFCGNHVSESQLFTIRNCTAPTAVCIDQLIVTLQAVDHDSDGIPDVEQAEVYASQFNCCSSHPCGYDLKYSFSLDTRDTVMTVDCEDISLIGIKITLYVTDINGNVSICTSTLVVQDNNDYDICDGYERCVDYPEATITVTSCSNDLSPQTLQSFVSVNPGCPCQDYHVTHVDTDITPAGSTCRIIRRNWLVEFFCSTETITRTFEQIITVNNAVAPTLTCGNDITVNAGANCNAFVVVPLPTYQASSCSSGLVITHNSPYASNPGPNASGTYPVGTTKVIFYISDACNHQNTCDIDITVLDVTPPTCVPENISVTIGPEGTVTITGAQIDGGSFDNCGIASLTASPSVFDCGDVGQNTVLLTVTDINGLTSTCPAQVTVVDNSGPLCSTQDIEIILDGNGQYVLDPLEIYTGSPCGGADVDLELSQSLFTCEDLGENTVFLTVTDMNTNETQTCSAVVTVTDTIAPVCELVSFTVQLDQNGLGSISIDNIDNGSDDPCGEIETTILSKSVFDCGDVGQNTVIVTMTDNNGNVTVCETTIFVEDNLDPECNVNDITVELDEDGTIVISATDLGLVTDDNCGVLDYSFIPNVFDCTDIGENVVVVTVNDVNGNSGTCEAVVTVDYDPEAPLCSADNLSVILDGDEPYTLDPFLIYTGSSCGGGEVEIDLSQSVFNCEDLGANSVTLTVTDLNTGATDVCTAIITITDTLAPVCNLVDYTLVLNANGQASLSIANINNGTFDPCGFIVNYQISKTSFNCSDEGENIITVTFTDNSGNVSVCETTITVVDNTLPVCQINDLTIELDDDGVVTVSLADLGYTGQDNCGIATAILNPSVFSCADIGENIVTVTVTDVNGNISTCTAVVTVESDLGPLCDAIDLEVILDGSNPYTLNPLLIYTGAPCGGGGVDIDLSQSVFTCEDIGDNIITLTVTDEQGNVDICTSVITVQDTIFPTCQLIDFSAYLDDAGEVVISLDDVDNGSFDECGEIVSHMISKDEFNCDDIGENIITVSFFDNSGNISVCETIVTVLDTVAPVCVANPLTIALDETGMAVVLGEQFGAGSFDVCSVVSYFVEPDTFFCNDLGFYEVILTVTDASGNSSTCSAQVEIVDVTGPVIECPDDVSVPCTIWPITDYSVFGEPFVFDECSEGGPVTETIIEDVNPCGVGIVTRNFTATDFEGNSSTCSQIIEIFLTSPAFSEENIIWGPATMTVDACSSMDPFVIGGAPTYNPVDVQCFMQDDFYSDVLVSPNNPCNKSRIRTWTVIDSCQYNPVTGAGVFTFVQTINAIDNTPPVIVAPSDTTLCDGAQFINLFGYATDCGVTTNVTVTNNSPFAVNNNSADASGTYPNGTHVITITATDGCGNVSTYTYTVVVYPYWGECRKIFRDIEDDGNYTLYLDEIYFPNPNCYDENVFTFSFSNTMPGKDTLQFHCSTLNGEPSVDLNIPIYLYQNGVFVEQFCIGILTLADEFGYCDEDGFVVIGGGVNTFNGQAVQFVELSLSGEAGYRTNTGNNGKYQFPVVDGSMIYRITPKRLDQVRNGINTLDLVFMQRHMLNIQKFDNPYKYIAADINKNNSISGADIFELRKLILGEVDTFKNNTSWRFVPKDVTFDDVANPFSTTFPAYFEKYFSKGRTNVDFIGIKTGDVTGDAKANDQAKMIRRSLNNQLLYTNEVKYKAGDLIQVPLRVEEEMQMTGIQLTLAYNPNQLEFVGIQGGALNPGQEHYSTRRAANGLVSFSWHHAESIDIESGEALFNLVFVAKSQGKTSDVIKLTDEILYSEWYDQEFRTNGLAIRGQVDSSFELYQNKPNPWNNTTSISFAVPEAGPARIAIRNVYGQVIWTKTTDASKGLNVFTISENEINTAGVLIIELSFNEKKLTRKMIKLN